MERFSDNIVCNNVMLYTTEELMDGSYKNKNGIILDDVCTKCTSKETFDSYTLDAEFVIDDYNNNGKTNEIRLNSILKVRTDYYNAEEQNSNYELFIITKITKDWDKYTITAKQVLYEVCASGYISDCRPTGNCNYALTQLLQSAVTGGLGYINVNATSDITDEYTAYYVNKTLEDSISGTDNSITSLWGAEIIRRGLTIQALQKAGNDTNIEIRQGKNITVWEESENTDNLYRAIVPIGKKNNNTNLYGSRVTYANYSITWGRVLPKVLIKEYPVMLIVQDETTDREEGTFYYTSESEALAKLEELAQADVEETARLKRDFRVLYDHDINSALQLGDRCKLIMERKFLNTTVRVAEREYDHLQQKITSLEVTSSEPMEV